MGIQESKHQTSDTSNTPKKYQNGIKDISELDPRSPSLNVTRTPIQVLDKSLVTKTDVGSETADLRGLDPRSPTVEFNRTPLIIPKKEQSFPSKLHNKLFDNVRRTSITTTPVKQHNNQLEKVNISPPKLLEATSTISTLKKEKRKSFVGILETNVDYTETNLDEYVKTSALDPISININDNVNNSINVIECKNCDPRSPTTDFLRTPIQIIKKLGEIDINNTNSENLPTTQISAELLPDENTNLQENLLKIVDRNDSDINVTNKSTGTKELLEEVCNEKTNSNENILKIESGKILMENLLEMETNEKTLEIENEVLTNDLINKIQTDFISVDEKVKYLFEETSKFMIKNNIPDVVDIVYKNEFIPEPIIKKPEIDLTANVENFDKKLSEIIYGSEKVTVLKRDNSGKPRVRTPLRDQNLIKESKSSKLKVSDKPRKLDFQVSKIPVFREKPISKKGRSIKYQCENTPPKSKQGISKSNRSLASKNDKSMWDSDKTIVI